MGKRPHLQEERVAGKRTTAVFLDAQGNRTDDPGRVQRGELVELDAESEPVRRTWFVMLETGWPRLGERSFLVLVLGLLLALWLVVFLLIGLA
jgi:hypothetical protein